MAAVNVALSMLLLVGCAALSQPEVSRGHNYGDVSIGDLHVRAVRLVKAADDRAVAVVATFVNYGPRDVLSEVTVKAGNANGPAGTVTPLRAEPKLSIAADAVVRVGGPGDPRIHLPDPQGHLRAGRLATVTFSFMVAGVAAVEVIVEEPGAYLAPFAPPSTTGRAPRGAAEYLEVAIGKGTGPGMPDRVRSRRLVRAARAHVEPAAEDNRECVRTPSVRSLQALTTRTWDARSTSAT